ncbi:MAG: nucleotidyl transferase AbiEii/AbiGii toxin family protein [Pseudomonadota bacterium]|nr:nucleotidyl transferase AbiEii/AbiGii toxin family protein [Pseudomonadota bacterium]
MHIVTQSDYYAERMKLLVEILPTLAKEKRFALKGGTVINLFEHDLPRLSIDIDLIWLPLGDFAQNAQDISAALKAIGDQLRSGPLRLQLQTSGTVATGIHRLIASRNRSRVQIDGDNLDARLWRTFLVYLTCSPKPAAEMLAPNEPRDFEQTFAAHFQGMTAAPVTAASLLDVRERLLNRITEFLDAKSRAFLKDMDFVSGPAKFTVISTVRNFRLGTIDGGDRCGKGQGLS